ncbi:MAG: bifunctional 4-hydroxy-2-oxoglutarate aldolase/2-dehydro-3-deoxy-phosphogluconate aldolase [Clostridiaceae bacterium]|jgi:2-dehydro-3-deoxyphosphogluconate aldolase/(4S)-4-hydroxy-2-oxoglutarate aldolase|nr:bifunctional 4-hydroxy-2-oxoglutarate aldolase/2-dehydro-3-deoxy-phosphogluconate aldolase [Clostridiaceae bacterium]
MSVRQELEVKRIVPVIVLEDVKDAVPLGEALIAGGLPLAEITFRTQAAEASIKAMKTALPQMTVGAGTIVSVEQAERARQAGASFIVTAGFSEPVTRYCTENEIPIFPGACTPTELLLLIQYGLDVAKFFPAKQFGGIEMIKALSGPFPSMKFMPTGGINADNLQDYLALPNVIACGGSWMVKKDLILAGRFDEITSLTRDAVRMAARDSNK